VGQYQSSIGAGMGGVLSATGADMVTLVAAAIVFRAFRRRGGPGPRGL
jgi:hypothetical protein